MNLNNITMDEAHQIVLDWADDYGLDLEELSYDYGAGEMEWYISNGHPQVRGAKDLQKRLRDEDYDVNFNWSDMSLYVWDYHNR